MDKEILLKRLTTIKLLYKIGMEQSRQSEATSFFSVLSFHDSIEMFLKLAAESKNIKSEKFSFMDYWQEMPHLTLKESMRNLNSIRVNLKHKGFIPSKIDVETCRVNAKQFFEQNTKSTFSVEFSEISLFDLIKFTETRRRLKTSQDELDKNQIEKCVEEVAISFEELLYEYKQNKMNWEKRTPFHFTKDIKFSPYNRGDEKLHALSKSVEEVVKDVNKNFDQIERAFEVISMGLDYRKFSKFKMLAPYAYRFSGGNYHVSIWGSRNWTTENCQFLIDFVLECALKLQEFDFSLGELETTEPFTLEVVE